MSRKQVTVSIDCEILRQIDAVAKELGTTRRALVEDSFRYFLDHLDLYLAEKRLENKHDEVVPAEKVWEEL